MYTETTAKTINAQSIIDHKCVVNMFASKDSTGSLNINVSVSDREAYEANREECDEDIATFRAEADEL